MLLYLDNCCFNRPFDDQAQLRISLETQAKLFVQQEILNGRFELMWSYILEYENNRNPFDTRRSSVHGWKEVATTSIIESEEILNFAEKIMNDGIKKYDALHLACAYIGKCDCFFVRRRSALGASDKLKYGMFQGNDTYKSLNQGNIYSFVLSRVNELLICTPKVRQKINFWRCEKWD